MSQRFRRKEPQRFGSDMRLHTQPESAWAIRPAVIGEFCEHSPRKRTQSDLLEIKFDVQPGNWTLDSKSKSNSVSDFGLDLDFEVQFFVGLWFGLGLQSPTRIGLVLGPGPRGPTRIGLQLDLDFGAWTLVWTSAWTLVWTSLVATGGGRPLPPPPPPPPLGSGKGSLPHRTKKQGN
jgi:hypothetical protein